MIDPKGVELVKDFEGCKLVAYLCPASVWTLGYGHTEGVREGMTCTQEQAEVWIEQDLTQASQGVLQSTVGTTNAYQLAAMTSLAFNIGINAFRKSTVLRCHNAGDAQAAGRAFNLWTKATVNGKLVELPGLVSRRAREAALYLTAARVEDRTPMPQALIEEAPVVKTPAVTGGAVAAGATGLAAVAESSRQISDIAWSASPIIDMATRFGPIVLAVVALGAIGWIIYSRFARRKQGWL